MSALAKNYNRRKIAFKKGRGSFLYSKNGKKYLDFVQGIAVNSLGHSNPNLIKAINKQAKEDPILTDIQAIELLQGYIDIKIARAHNGLTAWQMEKKKTHDNLFWSLLHKRYNHLSLYFFCCLFLFAFCLTFFTITVFKLFYFFSIYLSIQTILLA